MAYVEIPKELHPDFDSPGVKPTGPIEIDSSVELSKRTRHFYAPQKTGTMQNFGYEKAAVSLVAAETGSYYPEGFGLTSAETVSHSPYATFGYPFTVYTKLKCKAVLSSGTFLLFAFGDYSQKDFTGVTISPFLVRGQLDLNFNLYNSDVVTTAHKNVGSVIDVIYECISSTERIIHVWIDGSLEGSTTDTTDTTSHESAFNQFDKTSPALGLAVSNYYDILCTGLFDGQIADKHGFVRNPYQILKPAEPMFYFTAAGGTVVDVTVDMGLSVGQTNSGQATANGSITLAQEVGVSDSGQATANGSITLAQEVGVSDSGQGTANGISNLAMQLALSNNAIATVDTDVTLSNQMGYSSSGQANAQVSLPLDLSLEQSVSAIAQAVAQVTFSQNNGYAVSTAGLTVDVSTSMGIGLSMTPVIKVTMNGSITLSSELAQEVSANANTYGTCDLGFQVALQVASNALANASITIQAVTSITTTATSVIIGIITPDERSYTIEVDNRDFLILTEDRSYEVK